MMWDQQGLDATTTVNTIDHSAWKARFKDALAGIQDRVRDLWRSLARDPVRLQRLQMGLTVLLVLWRRVMLSLRCLCQCTLIIIRRGKPRVLLKEVIVRAVKLLFQTHEIRRVCTYNPNRRWPKLL